MATAKKFPVAVATRMVDTREQAEAEMEKLRAAGKWVGQIIETYYNTRGITYRKVWQYEFEA